MSRLLLAIAVTLAGCADRVVDAVIAGAPAGNTARRSCQEILLSDRASADGTYLIDPDGVGAAPPIQVFCDMTGQQGGWTRVLNEDFATPPAGFSKSTLTTCGNWGSLLGGHRTFGNETVTATVDLRGVLHSEVRVQFEFVVLDSWDHERAFADLDGVRVWSKVCDKGNPATCGQVSDVCGWEGVKDRNDGKIAVDVSAAHERGALTIAIGAMLDQAPVDESWGIDNFAVLVR